MANPNNAVGTNGAFGGRTSVNAFNDIANFWTAGIVSGWSCLPKSGLTVSLGGNGASRDVALAEDASGNKTTVNNISQSPIDITVNAAPASNSRVDSIVAYIEDSPNGSGITDNPDVVNLLVVSGTVASSPVQPNESTIRSAITADGASGSTAYYVVLASVTISTGTTDIDSTMITQGEQSQLAYSHTANTARLIGYMTNQLSVSDVTTGRVNGSGVYFENLDANKKYLLAYISGCSMKVISENATGRVTVAYAWQNSTSTTDYIESSVTASGTVRTIGTGADEVKLTFQTAFCFTGHDRIGVQLKVVSSTATIHYGQQGDSVLGLLFEVPEYFETNIS